MTILDQQFVFRLRVQNATRRDFTYADGELRFGRWYRDAVDNSPPAGIPAGTEAEAMGIWMPPGKTTGYECLCRWAAEGGDEQAGGFALTLCVPFLMGKNRAGLDVTGPYKIEGWSGISRLGREFSQTLIVREIAW